MKVSVVVNNYNYGPFLAAAVDSALAQTHPDTETIVVDDGSTDDSLSILAGYGNRIALLAKANGGQTSCMNAGFARANGEIVIFLDADDTLHADTAARAAAAFAADPRVGHVHWPLVDVDRDGVPTGSLRPPAPLAEGDLRDVVLRDGPNSYERVPTSGNAFSMSVLDDVMPLPEVEREVGTGSAAADALLCTLAPLYGRTAALAEPGGTYRVHGNNVYAAMNLARRQERDLALYEVRAAALLDHAARLGLDADPAPWRRRSWVHRLARAQEEILDAVPDGAAYALLDQGQLGVVTPGRRPAAFPESPDGTGRYWGVPADDAAAVGELERHEAAGVRHVAVLWPAFWWLDHFAALRDRLRRRYRRVVGNERVMLFRRRDVGPRVNVSPARRRGPRVIVTGMVGQQPLAGQACHYLQYVLGLLGIGADAWYVEDTGAPPYDPRREVVDEDATHTLGYLRRTMDDFGLAGRWAYRAPDGTWSGLEKKQVADLWATADVLLNVSGATRLLKRHSRVPVRALIDTDPHVTHVQIAAGRRAARLAAQHTHHFTFAGNVGRPGCTLPETPFDWRPTRQPVHLPLWPADFTSPAAGAAYTGVTNWKGYAGLRHAGRAYRGKEAEFRRLCDLPAALRRPAELALACADGANAEAADRLRGWGWRVRDALPVSGSLAAYRDFIAGSFAEVGVAKHGYVATRSGWFSERGACYLASGRPVLAQDTGFGDWLPCGEGLLAFADADDAWEADARLAAGWPRHARAARRLAEEHFDAGRVLRDLLDACAATPEPKETAASA